MWFFKRCGRAIRSRTCAAGWPRTRTVGPRPVLNSQTLFAAASFPALLPLKQCSMPLCLKTLCFRTLCFRTLFSVALCSMTLFSVALFPNRGSAADLEMVDGYGNITGVIDVSRQGLSVLETSGNRFFYQRARQYDLPGGQYLGFYNLALNRIVRFPRSGIGPIQRADLDAPFPQFVPGVVTVRPIGSGPGFAPYLDTWLGVTYGFDPYQTPWYGGGPLIGGPVIGGPFIGGPVIGGPLIGGRWSGGPLIGGRWSGGPYLSGYLSSGVSLSVGSIGLPTSPLLSTLPTMQPQSTLLESRVVELEPLSPIEVTFSNTINETLVVTLTDSRHPGRQPQYKIPPGGNQRVKLPRDGSQTRIDVYQTFDPFGRPIQREVEFAIEPEVRYEVVVHRIRIQSIAIDRTGKSPQPIEDVNMQGVGVGRFVLPPGTQLVSGTIDVFAAANAAANPGTVAPIITP